MSTIDFFNALPPYPSNPSDQVYYFDQLKVLLNNLDTSITDALVDVVTLEQATEPVQGDWETAYTTQTSKSLPIPRSAVLLWWDSSNNQFGGEFGTVKVGDGTVYPRYSANNPGATALFDSAYLSTNITGITYIIGDSTLDHPKVTFINIAPLKLLLTYQLFVEITSGAGSFGADFFLDGVKVGNTYYGLAIDRGLQERDDSGFLYATAEVPLVAPGLHEIQAIFGRTGGSTPTIEIGGGTNGIRLLNVRGIVQ